MTRVRRVSRWLLTAVAAGLVWFALAAPESASRLGLLSLVRLPVEGLVLVVLLLVLRGRPRAWLEALIGVVLALLVIVRVLDLGFRSALYRPFNPVTDWRYAGSAAELLAGSVGPGPALVILAASALAVLGLVVGTPLAVARLSRVVNHHRRTSLPAVLALALVWVGCAAAGLSIQPDLPVASSSAAALAVREVTTTRANLRDRDVFATVIPADPWQQGHDADLLLALRGKDVLLVFVESYGRVAVEGSRAVSTALDAATAQLDAAGYSSRSAWLTSPTFGGTSWLAHATLQSGLWVDSQQRYDQLLAARRLTLTGAFSRAGWRVVDVVPANRRDWPEGKAFYGYDLVYDARTLGYAGPGFGYAPMPDQYTLAAFNRLELEPSSREPVMAEIDLVSSHVPWAPLPHAVSWASIGDGSVFLAQAGRATPQSVVWSSDTTVRTAYGQSVAYSLDSTFSLLGHVRDRDLVLVVLGDHQPAPIVAGPGGGHDVPISVVARDPAVLDRIAAWGWSEGLRPGPRSPVWRMDQFRDRFLAAYGPGPGG
ncbi:CDP-alcohol phosphatidyltransferase [Intrasporangium calvum]|nr:CDP-alcohol phosphatidyltransferase [Intrasporangium calvum]